MIVLVVHLQQLILLIADRASKVTVKAIALCGSHSECTGERTVGRIFYACLRHHSWLCTVSSSVRFLIADHASRVIVKAIASHSECTGARTIGQTRVLMIAPTFLV